MATETLIKVPRKSPEYFKQYRLTKTGHENIRRANKVYGKTILGRESIRRRTQNLTQRNKIARETAIQHGQHWMFGEEEKLIKAYYRRETIPEIAEKFSRSIRAIRQRILVLSKAGRLIPNRIKSTRE